MHPKMCWASNSEEEAKVLYLQIAPNKPWQPYTSFPEYRVPDYDIPGGSKGWATYLKLRNKGWELVSKMTKDSVLTNP